MADRDVAFTFDPNSFQNGVNQIVGAMGALAKKSSNVAAQVTKGFSGVLKKVGLVGLAVKSVKFVLDQIPEVGKAFGIAKDIFFKNLFYPLRRFLMPLLQKMLNWVRDNRGMFAKWGAALVNVFRVVGRGVQIVFDFGKKILDTVRRIFSFIFGDTRNSIEDIINVITFKLAAVVNFIKILFEPIINTILSGIEKLSKPVGDLLALVGGLVEDFLLWVTGSEDLGEAFEKIAEFINGAFKLAFDLITGTLEKAVEVIQWFIGIFGGFQRFIAGAMTKEEQKQLTEEMALGTGVGVGEPETLEQKKALKRRFDEAERRGQDIAEVFREYQLERYTQITGDRESAINSIEAINISVAIEGETSEQTARRLAEMIRDAINEELSAGGNQ